MAFVDLLPRKAYKKLENMARGFSFLLEPVKKMTRGYAPFPWAVIAHLTYRCNLDCTMCCQHIADYTEILPGFPQPGVKNDELQTGRWKEILEDIADSFPILPFFHFSGGEPFLHAGLPDLVEHAKSRGYNVSIITNGWMLEQYAGTLVELGLNRLHVSIDGSEELHDQIRRREGSYRRAINGIRKVVDLRNARRRRDPHVTINCTITKENFRHLKAMAEVKEQCGADHLTLQHLVFFDHERKLAEGIDPKLLWDQLRHMTRGRKDVTVYAHVPKKKWDAYYRGSASDLGKGCGWNWVGLRIHPNGDVVPCRGVSVGSLRDGSRSIREIWNGSEYRNFRKELARVGNYEECGRCTHRLF